MKRGKPKKKKKPSGRRYEPIDKKHLTKYQKIKDDFLAAMRNNPDTFLGLRLAPTVEEALRAMLQEAIDALKRFNLPVTPHVFINKDNPKTYQPVRTEECQEKTYLPDFLLSIGYTWDSPEHLTAKKMCLIYEIDALGDWVKQYDDFKKNKSVYFFRLVLELGHIEALLGVNKILSNEGKGGRGIRQQNNPWRLYADHLFDKHPETSKKQILNEIPEEQNREIVGVWTFYIADDYYNGKEYLFAENVKSLKELKITPESFRVLYLSKNPSK